MIDHMENELNYKQLKVWMNLLGIRVFTKRQCTKSRNVFHFVSQVLHKDDTVVKAITVHTDVI